MSKSTCIYCQSEYYGGNCLFSPTGIHIHMSPDKCIYCGIKSTGSGCSYNPYGSVHVRGPEFLNRSNVQAEKTVILNYMLENLRQISTNSYESHLDRFYKRLASIILDTGEPLLETLSIQESIIPRELSKEQMVKLYGYTQKIKRQLLEMQQTLKEANLELPLEAVESCLLDAILK